MGRLGPIKVFGPILEAVERLRLLAQIDGGIMDRKIMAGPGRSYEWLKVHALFLELIGGSSGTDQYIQELRNRGDWRRLWSSSKTGVGPRNSLDGLIDGAHCLVFSGPEDDQEKKENGQESRGYGHDLEGVEIVHRANCISQPEQRQ